MIVPTTVEFRMAAKRSKGSPGPRVQPPSFTEQSACKDAGNQHDDLFFPGRPPSALRLRRVNYLFCDECPVRTQCKELGKSTGSEGVWGGEWFRGDASVREASLREEVIERVKAGESDGAISRMTGVSTSAVSDWRQQEGLPANSPYGSGITTEMRGTA